MNWILTRTKGDLIIWVIVFVLSIFSLLAVYSSTGTLAYKQSVHPEFYLFKHFGLMALGLGMMYMAHKINYKYYSRVAQVLLIVSVPLLIITYFMGSNINQASRWLTLPVVHLSFQTSDLAKLALIMYTARMLSKKQDFIDDFKQATLPVIWPVFLICALIAPSNLSTAAVLFATCLLLMFIGRTPIKHLAGIIVTCFLVGVTCISILYFIGQKTGHHYGRITTWVARVDNFFSPSQSEKMYYQNQQANIAVARGGFLGKGPGNSVQKNFLPNPYADFIFAIIIEEYGMMGGICLLVVYLMFLYRSIRIVIKSPRAFGALLAVGLSFMLTFQALINMGVAVHLFPVTGLTLPLVSMGGTSLWFTSIAFGIILSVSRDIEEKENLEVIAV